MNGNGLQHHEAAVSTLFSGLSEPLSQVAQIYLLQARICDRLERVADLLPAIDERQIAAIRPALRRYLPDLFIYEETSVLPVISKVGPQALSCETLCAQITREHAEDFDCAIELDEMLAALGEDCLTVEGDLAGFRLRAFFAALSRHIIWEARLVMSIAHTSLPAPVQTLMCASLPSQLGHWMARL